jgi:phosphate acetyltransferase
MGRSLRESNPNDRKTQAQMPANDNASSVIADPAPAPAGSKYDRLIAEAKGTTAAKAIVVHPCDETSLRGAIEAANAGLINPIFVGPAAKINRVARDHQLDISKFDLVDRLILSYRA